jgi:hypothetical protein
MVDLLLLIVLLGMLGAQLVGMVREELGYRRRHRGQSLYLRNPFRRDWW